MRPNGYNLLGALAVPALLADGSLHDLPMLLYHGCVMHAGT